jgi:hypothetical protein
MPGREKEGMGREVWSISAGLLSMELWAVDKKVLS